MNGITKAGKEADNRSPVSQEASVETSNPRGRPKAVPATKSRRSRSRLLTLGMALGLFIMPAISRGQSFRPLGSAAPCWAPRSQLALPEFMSTRMAFPMSPGRRALPARPISPRLPLLRTARCAGQRRLMARLREPTKRAASPGGLATCFTWSEILPGRTSSPTCWS